MKADDPAQAQAPHHKEHPGRSRDRGDEDRASPRTLLRFLLSKRRQVALVVPGDSARQIEITETNNDLMSLTDTYRDIGYLSISKIRSN